jgi:hypothetical protein
MGNIASTPVTKLTQPAGLLGGKRQQSCFYDILIQRKLPGFEFSWWLRLPIDVAPIAVDDRRGFTSRLLFRP